MTHGCFDWNCSTQYANRFCVSEFENIGSSIRHGKCPTPVQWVIHAARHSTSHEHPADTATNRRRQLIVQCIGCLPQPGTGHMLHRMCKTQFTCVLTGNAVGERLCQSMVRNRYNKRDTRKWLLRDETQSGHLCVVGPLKQAWRYTDQKGTATHIPRCIPALKGQTSLDSCPTT